MKTVHSKYNKQIFVLTTKHDKGRLIRPHLQNILDTDLQEINLDTDLLGTFSGEIERVGTPIEVAIKKARLGMQATNNPFGIASEGSVGPDPIVPFITANIETIVFIDDEEGVHISETIKSNEIIAHKTDTTKNDLDEFLKKADFPNHALIVKPNIGQGAIKGVKDLQTLHEAIKKSRNYSVDGEAIIESDLRAMCSPSRQRNISAVAFKLANRLAQTCPSCQCPGWGLQSFIRGVHCSECGDYAQDALKQEVLGCVRCDYTKLGAVINTSIDPSRCMSCNP